jgi:SAM-dependent methyltransferase
MHDWIRKLFVERSALFLKFLDHRWSRTGELVDGILKVLQDFGITSGSLLDLCCGNGRVSINMANRGFRAVGVDISEAFLEDAREKAREHGVSNAVRFFEGDVRNLRQVIGKVPQPFDVVVSAWTSIGYYSPDDDLNIFRQARELSREGAILFVAETMHSEFLSLKFAPNSYMELDDIILLENREYDPISSKINTAWTFYRKRGRDLEFLDTAEFELHVYSFSELCSLLRKTGWEPVASYTSLKTLQPMNPLGHMNVVAKAQ